ncbi:Glutathione-regulated potassium-efflux system ancillary protein KefG [Vibrio stylophorae]|uniref:Glutathione-regulated potassium-efflux system ancillary protein KefG n=1 Tax=Vibrio stylophorae TaxID=659351 RepID=A0ABM8ZTE9_9VIBR|nr:NAD(P)H-dependent oxidoreductase [Vibrio stylophorae]CAH0533593.1 Glutathione-regulated potassium-efflux system ancillary protein KefG [Vibrio stylophorae]
MSKVLVISGHPELATSNTNQLILNQLESQLEQVEIRRLDSLYPDYQIDVEAEQQALLSADIVVLQYPFFWYAMPAILKKWLDDVFCYNFAYGSKGDKLKGKVLLASFTIGGPEEAYDPLGFNHFTIEQLMHPMQQTAYLSGMQYHKPIYSHGMVYIPGVYNTLEGVQAKAMTHAERLIDAIHRLRQTPSNARENQVKTLAQQWFAQMDTLAENPAPFHAQLSRDVLFDVPEGQFTGRAGFDDWYAQLRLHFAPGCQHHIEQMELVEEKGESHLYLKLKLSGQTMAGDAVALDIDEHWQLVFAGDTPQISRYQVRSVQ